jgi:hypothetical protein
MTIINVVAAVKSGSLTTSVSDIRNAGSNEWQRSGQ